MSGRVVTVIVVLAIGYLLGAKFPMLAARVGLA